MKKPGVFSPGIFGDKATSCCCNYSFAYVSAATVLFLRLSPIPGMDFARAKSYSYRSWYLRIDQSVKKV